MWASRSESRLLTNNKNKHASVADIRILREHTHKIAGSYRHTTAHDKNASLLELIGVIDLKAERRCPEYIDRNGHVVDFEGRETVTV